MDTLALLPDRRRLRRVTRSVARSVVRDMAAATAVLRGKSPPPWNPRDSRAWPSAEPTPAGPPLPRTVAAALVDRSRLPATAQPVRFRLPDGERTVQVPPGHSILAAARAAGLTLPFSCTLGGCGSCRQHMVQGEVLMRRPNCLSAEEEARGDILLCVSHPKGEVEIAVRPPPELPGQRGRA